AQHPVWLVDAKTGALLHKMAVGNSFLWDLKFNADSSLLAGADIRGFATIWDVARGGIRMRCRGGAGRMTWLGFTAGNQLITLTNTNDEGEFSKRLQLWEVTNGQQLDARLDLVEVTRFAMTPSGQDILCGKQGSLWHFPLAPPEYKIDALLEGDVSFIGDRFLLAVSGQKRGVGVYDLGANMAERLFFPTSNTNSRHASNGTAAIAMMQPKRGDYRRFGLIAGGSSRRQPTASFPSSWPWTRPAHACWPYSTATSFCLIWTVPSRDRHSPAPKGGAAKPSLSATIASLRCSRGRERSTIPTTSSTLGMRTPQS
ncbi:MAG: hypothetical protein ACI8W8_002336, partial [Rhodothermales bacterium]